MTITQQNMFFTVHTAHICEYPAIYWAFSGPL